MIFSRLLQLALVVMALAGPSAPASARFMQANNSYVQLDLPETFRPESRFAGFYSKDSGATIMVLDMPRAAYQQFTNRFDKELEHKGYSEVRQSKLRGRHDDHLFFFARQHTPVGQFDKYLLIIRDQKRAAYVTITVNPIEKVETPLSYIEAQNILAKVKFSNHRAVIDKPYDLTYLGLFKERNTIVGSTTIYALKKTKKQMKGNALFVIAPSLSRHKVADLAATGRALMAKFSRFRNMNLTAEEKMNIGGMRGYGLSGTAIKKSGGQRVGVYQLVLANPAGGYFRIVGVAPHKNFPFFLQEFRQMAASFRLK